jgi:predicted amidohydrolase
MAPMHRLRISVVSQSFRDFPSFGKKLEEAAGWMQVAGHRGSDLVVFPEYLNGYRGDGPAHPNPLTFAEAALDDWKSATELLFDAAARAGVDFVLPLVIREEGRLFNCFLVIDSWRGGA